MPEDAIIDQEARRKCGLHSRGWLTESLGSPEKPDKSPFVHAHIQASHTPPQNNPNTHARLHILSRTNEHAHTHSRAFGTDAHTQVRMCVYCKPLDAQFTFYPQCDLAVHQHIYSAFECFRVLSKKKAHRSTKKQSSDSNHVEFD